VRAHCLLPDTVGGKKKARPENVLGPRAELGGCLERPFDRRHRLQERVTEMQHAAVGERRRPTHCDVLPEADGARVAGGLTEPAAVLDASHAARSYAGPDVTEMRLFDLRVTVERIEGRSVCGLQVGDYFEVTESSRIRIPEGRHFCMYALQAVLPLLPAKQRRLPESDWLEQDSLVACPDPDERVVMRIERIGERTLRTEELT
jgi:uncharacterized repeat protein (TIGR04076 family)